VTNHNADVTETRDSQDHGQRGGVYAPGLLRVWQEQRQAVVHAPAPARRPGSRVRSVVARNDSACPTASREHGGEQR